MSALCGHFVRNASAIYAHTNRGNCDELPIMRTAEELRARVKAIRNEAGLSVRDMARLLDMSPSGYSHYEQRIKEPYLPAKIAKAIADVVEDRGVNRSAVLILSSPSDEMPTPRFIAASQPKAMSSELVPVYDIAASAGDGAFVAEYEAEADRLAFPSNFLRKLTQNSIDNLAIISVKGESMEPTLLDDDIVLLDCTKTNLSFDGLFVLRFDDALHVKRVSRAPKRGYVTIISDNQTLYPSIEMATAEVDVVGKVLWYGRRV